jgi:ankyrin repeat protein
LKKDEQRLHIESKTNPASLGNVNFFGQNALHFATEWTHGLRTILESDCITDSVLNHLDYCHHSALDYAAMQGNTESMECLIKAGACFNLRLLPEIRPNCRKILISTLYERRRQLKNLAMEHSGFKEDENRESFGLFTSDSASSMYLQIVEDSNITITEYLWSSVLAKGSLFHPYSADYLGRAFDYTNDKETIKDLLANGFVHVDESWKGVTPLMALQRGKNVIEIADMLLKYGADPNNEFPMEWQLLEKRDDDRRYRAVHGLASVVGQTIGYMTFKAIPGALEAKGAISQFHAANHLQKTIFESSQRDLCSCYCSPVGCTALTCFFKGLSRQYWSTAMRSFMLKPRYGRLQLFDLDSWNASVVARDIIRMMTFNSLSLTHTCCLFEGVWASGLKLRIKEQVEIYRIHEEERDDLELLAKLMEDFTLKFIELQISLEEFITGYWRERMAEELYKKTQIPTNELERQRELGVWLKEEQDPKHDFFEGIWLADDEIPVYKSALHSEDSSSDSEDEFEIHYKKVSKSFNSQV